MAPADATARMMRYGALRLRFRLVLRLWRRERVWRMRIRYVVMSSADCGPQYVERTVMVPEWGTETRIVNATEYRSESRERTITVNRRVAETQQRTQTYTVNVPQTKTRTVSYTVSKPVYETQSVNYTVNVPVWNDVAKEYTVQVPYTENVERSYTVSVPVWSDVEQSYTVMVPQTETRQATRTVCRRVAETSTRTVTRDQGHWETQMVEVACNGGSSSYGGCGSLTAVVVIPVVDRIVEAVDLVVVTAHRLRGPCADGRGFPMWSPKKCP